MFFIDNKYAIHKKKQNKAFPYKPTPKSSDPLGK